MGFFSTSYNGTNYCPSPTTSDCVSFQGASVSSLGICTGMSMTSLEAIIIANIQSLLTTVDVSSIIIPACLTSLWGTNQPTIYNFINTLVQESCVLQSEIDVINTTLLTFNPLVTVDYACCSTNPCITTGTVTLTTALQNIISCVCTTNSTISSLQGQITILNSQIASLNTTTANQLAQINTLTTNYNSLLTLVQGLQTSIDCLNHATGNNC